ncbi:MAG: hypothetical protein COV34_02840 [Candidatus Zambryskibacteria bacterium CG10_big_fil_rev_8_21_14_0_10_42_12]|uniref:DUF2065 domain-containing protein n=1 Tax=Candidatus Zambryskibacteria bacterium CG10_big_fil_rev_8_21_14_0_10_42_12 TaxID=1975115 RepID=A0A2H0QUN8_9BACT|nr:MAG: hypothetical protein COV34_02840 [Candidatus Zambryskibacteria bacterium CG10_big_fil_rev_8_21_14_0_10_42_12]
MELSIFLSKIFGIWFLVIGIIFIWRRKTLMPVIEEFAGSRALLILIALLELFAGIALVTAHNIWEKDFRLVLTIISWWLVIEGVMYLMAPTKSIKKIFKRFNKPGWYISGSLLSIVLGVYLLNAGFTM